MLDKIVILGAGESGCGTALLAKKQGWKVFVSDHGTISKSARDTLDGLGIEWEEETHTLSKMKDAQYIMKSPGIPAKSPILQSLKSLDIPVISEIEFASKYNSKIIIVDPTPRAIKHYDEIINRLGNSSKTEYLESGKQPINSYNLINLKKENLILFKKALWNKNEKLRFFSPPNPEHVSHSIINYQNQYKKNTNFIEVDAITIDKLLDQLNLNKDDIPLIKLDIEGAEIEFLIDCFSKGFRPRQILVEFDELNVPSRRGFERVTEINQILIKNNYQLIKTDGKADFLYLKN